MEPQVRYVKTEGGVSIAYCVAGKGHPLLLPGTPPFSHVQLDWEGLFAFMYAPMAKNHRVVWFDWPGTGLSDRDAFDFSMPALMTDIETVVEQTGLGRFAVQATASATLIAVTFAASHPEQVSHLILADGWTRFSELRESPAWQAEKALRRQDWRIYSESLARIAFGFHTEFASEFAAYMRACAEPEAFWAAYDAVETYDVSEMLSGVCAHTLVVQNRTGNVNTFRAGQRLAAAIPGARFIVVDDPTYAQLPALIEEFMAETPPEVPAPPESPHRKLSPREREVLRLLASGKSSREISEELTLTVRTVERHVTNIYRKIDAHNRAQATAYALEHGLTRRS